METVTHPTEPSVPDDLELHLLTPWESEEYRKRARKAGLGSTLVHVVLIVILVLLPKSVTEVRRQLTELRTPLIAPPAELTQKEPNKGKISKEANVEQLLPRPRIQVPPSPPSTTRAAAPRAAAMPSQPVPAPPAALPEPPKIEASTRDLGPQLPPVTPPPPQIQPVEKPKLALENVTGGNPQGTPAGKVPVPNSSVSEAIRSATRGGAGGGLVVGDIGEGAGGIGEAIRQNPSPGRPASALELLSDPMGVDFRPYLIRVLTSVRRNWFAVMPESARMGRRGQVVIIFAISKNGAVPKLVFDSQSGTDAFDRAAVAGISASTPFPPLPSEFRGEQIRLRFKFSYNVPK